METKNYKMYYNALEKQVAMIADDGYVLTDYTGYTQSASPEVLFYESAPIKEFNLTYNDLNYAQCFRAITNADDEIYRAQKAAMEQEILESFMDMGDHFLGGNNNE